MSPDGRTWNCGERHHRAKLDQGQVIEIIEAVARRERLKKELTALTDQALADRHGVSKTTVRNIAIGKTWRHV